MVVVAGSTLATVILYGVGLKKRTTDFTYHIRLYILACTKVAGTYSIHTNLAGSKPSLIIQFLNINQYSIQNLPIKVNISQTKDVCDTKLGC